MKLRVVSKDKELLLYCLDGTIQKLNDDALKMLFIGYPNTSMFSGKDGYWNTTKLSMEEAPGTTVAYVNDENELCIGDANPFYKLISSAGNSEYITVQEYAKMHNKGEARIKVLCSEYLLSGAVKRGSRWFIPINAPYPKDKRSKSE